MACLMASMTPDWYSFGIWTAGASLAFGSSDCMQSSTLTAYACVQPQSWLAQHGPGLPDEGLSVTVWMYIASGHLLASMQALASRQTLNSSIVLGHHLENPDVGALGSLHDTHAFSGKHHAYQD